MSRPPLLVAPLAGTLVLALALFGGPGPGEDGPGPAFGPRAAWAGEAAPDGTDGSAPPALVIEAGSRATRQVVAVGRDVVIAGEALSDVAALDGSVRVDGTVDGDVIVLSGDVRLGPEARVRGDVFALGGSVETVPGATIGGRTVAYPTASSTWITLLEGPTLGLPPGSPVVLGAKLALMAAWMILALLIFATVGRESLATSDTVRRGPLRCFFTGLVGVLALTLTAVLFSALAPPLVGAPILVLLALAALILKLWGMVAVFHALGEWLARKLRWGPREGRIPGGRPLALNAVTLGLVALGALKFVPYLGAWAWTVATLIGVGAALASKLGRDEAWFRLGELDRLTAG